MIIEGLISIFCGLIQLIFTGISFFDVPTSAIAVLVNIAQFSTWVLGGTLTAACFGCIMFWFTFRMSFNFAIWVYKLIPFI